MPQNIQKAFFYFYVDDTAVRFLQQTNLQHTFNSLQDQLCLLQRVLSADKSKLMFSLIIFMNKKSIVWEICYKRWARNRVGIFFQTYRGFNVITTCFFRITFSTLPKAEGFVGVLRQQRFLFLLLSQKEVCWSYICICSWVPRCTVHECLCSEPSHAGWWIMVDHAIMVLWDFITNCGFLTHNCTLCSKVNETSLSTRQLARWYVFIYKAILDMIVFYLHSLLTLTDKIHSLQSFVVVQLVIPKTRAGLGKMAYWFSAHFTWNSPQIVQNLFTLGDYKSFYYLYVHCEWWEFDRFLFFWSPETVRCARSW